MKKSFRYYLCAWAIMFVVFQVISFVSVGWSGQEKYTPSFWIGYVFVNVAFLGQIACAYIAFRADTLQKLFYNIPIISISFWGLIVSFVVGGLCMIISPLPYWVGVILCTCIMAVIAIAVIKASAAADVVSAIDDKIKTKTFYIRSLTIDAEGLIERAKSENAQEECRKVYEAVRYSDPMSHEALSGMEAELTIKFAAFSEAVKKDDNSMIESASKEFLILLNDRNRKCKLLK